MIHSMTGFGRGEASSDGFSVTAELKSVNSRYLNISLRIPRQLQEKELALKEQIQAQINRGKLNLNLRIDKAETGRPDIAINKKLAEGYKNLLDELRDAANIQAPVTLQDLMDFDDIFTFREQDDEILQKIWELSKQALSQALDELIKMRRQEGRQLEQDLQSRAEHIQTKMKAVRKLTKDRAEKARNELLERIGNLVDEDTLDHDRLEMEVAVLVDKMDITEEIVRLQSHVKFFKEALENDETVGRRLKFLAQEMNREINTIGSKANNTEISKHVVAAKESLEKIREQVENVE